jgi:excisionase family DNA binding protein
MYSSGAKYDNRFLRPKSGDSGNLITPESANDVSDLSRSGRQDLNLRHSAPKTRESGSQALAGVSNERESFESDPEFHSNDHAENATFAADLLRRYYQNSRMLGVREVAERLRVCTATVYKLCASGALEHVRVVNSIRVTEAALSAFLTGRRSGG